MLLVGLLLLTTSGCTPSVLGGGDERTVTAYFADTAGLFVGNDVGILGVTIGEITDIEPEGAVVKVTMEVEAGRKLPDGVRAVVVARSVATDRYVELTPAYAEGQPELAAGEDIPVERTATPVDFDEVLQALNTFSTGIAGSKESRDAVKRIVDNGSAALQGRGRLVNDTVTDLAGAVGDVTSQRQDISAVIRSLDGLVATLADNDRTTREFITQVTEAADLLDDEKAEFREALRNLDAAVTTIAEFARDHRDEIVETIDSTSTTLETINTRREQLIEILEVFPVALQNLRRAGEGEFIPVRIPPKNILPLGTQLAQLCQLTPTLDLCTLLTGTTGGTP